MCVKVVIINIFRQFFVAFYTELFSASFENNLSIENISLKCLKKSFIV